MLNFKKNQEGNKRKEEKLANIDKKAKENARAIKDHIIKYESEVKSLKSLCDSADTRADDIEDKLNDLTKFVNELGEENLLLRKRVFQLEKDSKITMEREDEQKRMNILIQGIPESAYKKTKADVTELLEYLGIQVSSSTVTNIHRVGPEPKSQNYARQIKVKFTSTLSKQDLFQNIAKLKNSDKWKKIGINDDLSEVKLSKQRDLRSLAVLARVKGQTAQQQGDFLIINEQKFMYKDINNLPFDLSLEEDKLRPTKDGLAFQGPHVYLSNLADAPFVDDDTPYRSMEEYFQCKHASHAGNKRILRLLRESQNSYDMLIHTDDAWKALRRPTMSNGLRMKFDRNPVLKKKNDAY